MDPDLVLDGVWIHLWKGDFSWKWVLDLVFGSHSATVECIQYKIVLLTYKFLNGMALPYLRLFVHATDLPS